MEFLKDWTIVLLAASVVLAILVGPLALAWFYGPWWLLSYILTFGVLAVIVADKDRKY